MTRIDPPQSPLIKQSEPTNSQHNVDQQTPDDTGHGQDFKGEGFKDVYEDLTDVSIEALITFLQGLMGEQELPPITDPATIGSPAPPLNPANPNARAAMAYQSHAPSRPAISVPESPSESAPQSADEPPQSKLDQATANLDQNELKNLIRALMQLSAKGHQSLSLQKSDSFLASIRQAVQSL